MGTSPTLTPEPPASIPQYILDRQDAQTLQEISRYAEDLTASTRPRAKPSSRTATRRSFPSLIDLVEDCSIDDRVAWIGEQVLAHAGETTRPNTITNIDTGSEYVRVDGDGIRGGEYVINAYEDGSSEAYYNSPIDILPVLKGEDSRVKRIEDSRTSQISDLLSVGILRFATHLFPRVERPRGLDKPLQQATTTMEGLVTAVNCKYRPLEAPTVE